MARKKDKPCPPLALWLVTFSDLITLLLTFFVLLLTMSSMDQSFLTRVTVSPKDLGPLEIKGAGKISADVLLVAEIIERPWEILEKQSRIKDLLYPEEELPQDISTSTLFENLDVIAKDDGVALVFTDKLLFPRGGSELDESARTLLNRVAELLWSMDEQVNIAAYTDDVEEEPWQVSERRALAVLAHLVEVGLPRTWFTLSAYGPTQPRADNDTEAGRARNRRVEILIQSNRPLGAYSP